MSCHCTRNITLKLVPVLYNLYKKVFSRYWHCTAPEMTLTQIPNPEMIPKWTPKWSPFLFTSTPKWPPINYWNGMVFSDKIIASLLQCLRSWVTFNISPRFMLFRSTFVINLFTFMSTFFYLKHHFKILKSDNTTFLKFTIQGMQFWHNPGYDHLSNKIMNNRKCYVHWCYQLRFMVLLKLYSK